MSSKKPLMLAAFLAVAVAGCNPAGEEAETTPVGDDATGVADDTMPDTMPADTMPAGTMPDDAAAADTDAAGHGETLGLIVVVNEHEIAAAEQAREKEVRDDVREYADMLHEEHTDNLEATRELADANTMQIPATSTELDAQRAKGESQLQRLGELTGEAYETAFLEAMVKDHTDALSMIDDRMAAATGSPIEEHLTTTREVIAKHLAEAQALQGGAE